VFSAAAVGTAPLTYLWQKEGVALTNGPTASGATVSGATSSNLLVAGVAYLDAGNYAVNITNGLAAGLTSSNAALVVRDPYIITQPVSRTNVVGSTATFTVTANGTPTVTYAWYKDNVALTDGGEIFGSATTTLTVSPVGNFDIGSYYALVGSGSGSNTTSATATLKVLSATPQAALYWDGNGNTPGSGDAPTGTWGTGLFWNTDVDGSLVPGGWIDGSVGVFSAGTDEINPYTVTVSSVQTAAGLIFEEGDVTVNGGTISFASTNGQSIISVTNDHAATIGSVLAGANDLVKTGAGLLRLNANNTHSGRTIIKEGTVSVQADARFGAIPLSFRADEIMLDGGTLDCNATGNPGQQSNPLRGILITTNNGTISESAGNGTGAFTMFGSISGPGKLFKTGISILRLEATNTYSGGTDLNDGKIYVNSSGGLGTGVLTINTTAGMILRTALATATTVSVTNSVVLLPGANPLISAGGNGTAAHFELDGVISGDGGLTRGVVAGKDVIITGANTYLGGTTVDVGRLLVNNTAGSGTGSGAVMVNSAGVLGGSGTITGAVTTAGGTISPGNGAGKLTLQNGLDMSAGGTNVVELAALKDDATGIAGVDFDQVALTGGALNLSGATLTGSFMGTASAPSPTNAFWRAPHTWTIIALSGGAVNPGPSNFTALQNANTSAGIFTTSVAGNGSILLNFTPTLPSIQSVSADATSTTISWNAANGANYQVQYKTNLSEANWLPLTNITGAGTVISITDEHGGDPLRFYRLALVP
jgi:autotransporter-associated beta strand protein